MLPSQRSKMRVLKKKNGIRRGWTACRVRAKRRGHDEWQGVNNGYQSRRRRIPERVQGARTCAHSVKKLFVQIGKGIAVYYGRTGTRNRRLTLTLSLPEKSNVPDVSVSVGKTLPFPYM